MKVGKFESGMRGARCLSASVLPVLCLPVELVLLFKP